MASIPELTRLLAAIQTWQDGHGQPGSPCVASRREAVFAAVEAHNRTNPAAPLPRPAARLLEVMFATPVDVCCLSQQALAAEGFGKSLPGVLRALAEAGLVLRHTGTSRIPDTDRLLALAEVP